MLPRSRVIYYNLFNSTGWRRVFFFDADKTTNKTNCLIIQAIVNLYTFGFIVQSVCNHFGILYNYIPFFKYIFKEDSKHSSSYHLSDLIPLVIRRSSISWFSFQGDCYVSSSKCNTIQYFLFILKTYNFILFHYNNFTPINQKKSAFFFRILFNKPSKYNNHLEQQPKNSF